MAGEIIGANVAQLRDLAMHFEDAQERIHTLAGIVTARVNQPGYWGGDDADRFRSDWNSGHRSRLLSTQTLLSTAARDLRRNADEQERTSGSDTGTTTPGGPGGPGTPGGPGNPGDPADPGAPGLPGILGPLGALAAGLKANDLYSAFTTVNSWRSRIGLPVTALRLLNHLQLSGSFASLDDALRVAGQGQLFNRLGGIIGGAGWADELQKLSNIIPEGVLARGAGSLAGPLGTAGRILGPLGVVLGGVTIANDLHQGNYGRAAFHGLTTGLGAAALFTPPPVNLALGLAAGGLALGELAYDHIPVFRDAVNWTGETLSDAAGAVSEGLQDVGEGIADAAEDLWPF